MSKHTGGDWYYHWMDGDPNSDRWLWYIQSGESEICGGAVGNLSSKDPDECQANISLMTAAPDLLAALEAIEDELDAAMGEWAGVEPPYLPLSYTAMYESRAIARAAITKAKGSVP